MPAVLVDRGGKPSVEIPFTDWHYHNLTCEKLHALFKADHFSGYCRVECKTAEEASELCGRANSMMTSGSGEPAPGSMVTNAATGQTIGVTLPAASSGSVVTWQVVNSSGKSMQIMGSMLTGAGNWTTPADNMPEATILREFSWLKTSEDVVRAAAFAKFCIEKMKSLTALDLLNGDTRSLMSEEDVAGFVRDVLGLDVDVTIKGRGDVSSGDGGNAGEDILHE